jgi:class 3 adenylate cyclase
MLEEASIAAVNGELTPFASGVTACRMISACRDLSDFRRASEWIEATERYCKRESVAGFPGVCRVHRAEVAAVGGAWDKAETDLLQATVELEKFRATQPQGDGFYALGEIRRLRGDIEGAEEALREAHARGRSPQPALALIRLGEGKIKAAAAAIEAALDEEGTNAWGRARLLPAHVEILLAAGDVARARAAVNEFSGTIAQYPSPAMEARRRVALGRVLIAEGDPIGGAKELRGGIRSWQEVGAPYEVARARADLGAALRALDDPEDAVLELRAALDELRRLGAPVDAATVERQLADAEDRRQAPEQVRRAFMFTDIVGSTTLAEALGDAAWDRVLRWHDDTLRRQIGAGGGEVVKTTGDGFFAAFPSARKAVDCAVAIQRKLRDQQASAGFVPPVRIGVHAAEANRRGMDYSGIGVHVAARVGALAGSGEILATVDTLREAGEAALAGSREVSVKGVSAPIEVATVSWG